MTGDSANRRISPSVKTFSFFELALRFSNNVETENLGQISSISRRDFVERETFLFGTSAPGVEYACLMIENTLLLQTNRSGRVYAGFEKLSCLQPVIERYLRIADVSESVYIFGEPDWRPPRHPNIRTIRLGSDFRLARESFLIVESSSMQVALVACDEEGLESKTPDRRNFSAVKTSNRLIVARLATAAEGVIDWSIAA